MDYQKIYDHLVFRAKNENRKKKQGISYEAHHITPKCLGGEGECHQWRTHPNIILLTPREHFIAHLLLLEIYPKNYKLKHATWFMLFGKSGGQNRDYKVSSRTYERLKEEKNKANSETLKGRISPLKGRIPWNKGMTNLFNKGKEPWNKGKPNGNKGIKRPDLSEMNRKNTKPINQFTKDGDFIKSWGSGAEASRELNIDQANINACCKNKIKSAGGFIWKYV
jgi:hypothetical protein